MKRFAGIPVTLFAVIVLAADCCVSNPTPTATPENPTSAPALLMATEVSPIVTTAQSTPKSLLRGTTITVTHALDSDGSGTLRRALEDAQPNDTITFDPAVFPPGAPVAITVNTELPHINHKDHLTLDASDAGVVLDGSQVGGQGVAGLRIVDSDGVSIQGLQISRFSGPGIAVSGDSKNNVIGGDRSLGDGPFGQGNSLIHNEVGIDLATHGTSLITVTGNLIGTGATGHTVLGNHRSGVLITDGAHGNTIGPDNLIAYNREHGIFVEDPNSSGNRFTQNSIHKNGGSGIYLVEGSNAGIRAPYIFSVDMNQGIVTGNACAMCTIEIFSTQDGEEGKTHEGRVVAESNGAYTFAQGGAFRFENITSVATDENGNTSGFSRPAGIFDITDDTTRLQEVNGFPAFLLLPKRSQFLLGHHIGAWFEDYDRYYDTDFVYRNGFKRIRIGQLAGRDYERSTIINLESLSPEVDATISEYAENGVEIVLILGLGSGLPFNATFQSKEEIDLYLEYVRFVVSHFEGRIPYYEIWNEPGGLICEGGSCLPAGGMLVDDYVHLVEETVDVIRGIDPDAKIIIGAIPGNWEDGDGYEEFGYDGYQRFSLYIDYMNALVHSGVITRADGISWHPLYDNTPSDPYYQGYPDMVRDIKILAEAQGFTGEYFADEIMWVTVDEENWENGPPVSQTVAAKYYARAIVEHRGLGVNVTINTFFQVPCMATNEAFVQDPCLGPIQNLCTVLAGAEPTDMTLSLETGEDANVRYYAFTLPDGEKLVALWTNDEAVGFEEEIYDESEHYGVSTTLTISNLHVDRYIGYSVQSVIGIDVFHGFEQELVTETENGDLVIRNLLVKDYPIILRLVE